MIDVDKALKILVKTGKVFFGSNQAISKTQSGKAKLLIVASNCPSKVQDKLQKDAQLSNIPIITYSGSGLDLGVACGKPFSVSVLTVRVVGESDILKVLEE